MTPTDHSTAVGRLPALFVAHGAPPLLDDRRWMQELSQWAGSIARPKAILMLSAHWEARPLAIGATRTVPLVYDFYGFPQHYYQQTYAAPGAPELAQRIRSLMAARGQMVQDVPDRGLDHGAYVPLVAMYPQADIPVLQVSMPSLDPATLFELGRTLAPLRDEGILIVGSGFLTHNLRRIDWEGRSPPPTWAQEFDQWVAETLSRRDVDALLQFRTQAPGAALAHPTDEHFVPVIAAAGAAADDAIRYPITGFWLGSFTRRSVQFG